MQTLLGFFEDKKARQFLPLTWTRPVFDLRCGIDRLYEKMLRLYDCEDVVSFCRPLVGAVWAERNTQMLADERSGRRLWINGRIIADESLADQVPLQGEDAVYLCENEVAALRCDASVLMAALDDEGLLDPARLPETMPREQVIAHMAHYPWDLIDAIAEEIHADIQVRNLQPVRSAPEGVFCIGRQSIYIDPSAQIMPGSVLDASNGPIYIDADVYVAPLCYLEGPLSIGAGGKIKSGAKLYGGVALGPVSKIGGEVEGSIVQGFSNKQHEGFLGHAFLGEWINLGAGTNNSDLKNNYGDIKVVIDGRQVDTGRQLMGLIMGDHAKSAIGTRFNTGTVAGCFANVFKVGFPQKAIPDFAWLGEKLKSTRLPDALGMADRVMARREVVMNDNYRTMVESIYRLIEERKDRQA